jgi:hypothetical protein
MSAASSVRETLEFIRGLIGVECHREGSRGHDSRPASARGTIDDLREGPYQRRHAQNVDHAFHVVGQHGQAGLRAHLVLPSHQEVALVHPALDRTKRVLREHLALPHDLRMLADPLLHALQDSLILPSRDPSTLFVARTLRFQRTGAARGRGVGANRASLFHRRKPIRQRFTGRAAVHIGRGIVLEALFPEQSELGIRRRVGFGDVRDNPLRVPTRNPICLSFAHATQDLNALLAVNLCPWEDGDVVAHVVAPG